jgi:lysozyme
MKFSLLRILVVLQVLVVCARASNSVVNLSHYDLMRVDFDQMQNQGIVGVIHEATYPRNVRDERYVLRQGQATRAGLLWGAYHYANASDPIAQADFFLRTVSSAWHSAGPASRPDRVLLVLGSIRRWPSSSESGNAPANILAFIPEKIASAPS